MTATGTNRLPLASARPLAGPDTGEKVLVVERREARGSKRSRRLVKADSVMISVSD